MKQYGNHLIPAMFVIFRKKDVPENKIYVIKC